MATFLLTKSQINILKKKFINFVECGNNPYIDFIIKNKDTLINVYKSKKIVFIKGDQSLIDTLLKWQNQNQMSTLYTDEHIGSDEVGTGDFFGPIIVCAAFLKQNQAQELLNNLVKDSKLISDANIRKVAPILISKVPHHILILNNFKYNQIIQKENMNSIKAKLHNQAIKLLLKRVNTKTIIIDQFTTVKSFYNYFDNQKEIVSNLQFFTKAESKYLAVAIASIIARYHFLLEMDKLSKKFKIAIPFGANHQKIDAVINKFSKEELLYIAKLNFKNYKKII